MWFYCFEFQIKRTKTYFVVQFGPVIKMFVLKICLNQNIKVLYMMLKIEKSKRENALSNFLKYHLKNESLNRIVSERIENFFLLSVYLKIENFDLNLLHESLYFCIISALFVNVWNKNEFGF